MHRALMTSQQSQGIVTTIVATCILAARRGRRLDQILGASPRCHHRAFFSRPLRLALFDFARPPFELYQFGLASTPLPGT